MCQLISVNFLVISRFPAWMADVPADWKSCKAFRQFDEELLIRASTQWKGTFPKI